MKHAIHSFTLAVALTGACAPAQALTYQPEQDWVDAGHSGPWSFGWDHGTTAYQFKAFDQFTRDPATQRWQSADYQALGCPTAFLNLAASPLAGIAPGALALHPGPNAGNATGDAAVLRFTAAWGGLYSVTARFDDGDIGETQAWVVLNSNFLAPVSSLGFTSPGANFQGTLALSAGDTLDFLVGNQGDFYFDSTSVAVSITTAVPEASTLALLLTGLLGLGISQGRRDPSARR